jgi:dihydrolipoamide dehydrogenase
VATYDLAIIGAGPGGYVAAIRAGQLGLKVVVIERDERLGGTCLLRGCIPTKCLLHSASVLEEAKASAEIGVHTENVRVEMAGVNKYKDKIVAKNAKGVEFLFRKNKVERLHGHGRLMGPGKVSVTGGKDGEKVIEAKHVLLATGSAPRLLPGLKVDGTRIVTSDELLRNEAVPKRLIVLGAGAVGIEFASVYQRFGSEVTVVEALPRLLPVEDEDVSAEMEKAMRRRGVKALVSAKLEKVEVYNDAFVRAILTTAKGTETLEAEMFLCAIGRRPVTEGLDLEKFAKVTVDRGFVQVDPKTLLTGEEWLSAIGDIVTLPGRPHPQLAHLAQAEGIFVVERLAGHKPTPVNYDLVPGATYSEPEVGSVGLTEKQAKEKGHEVKAGKFPFSALGRAIIHGETGGFVKLVADSKTGQLLGAHIVGPYATELIAEPALTQLFQGDAWEMGRNIHPHPTLSEAVMEAALAVDGRAIHI